MAEHDINWLHSQAAIATQFDYQDKGQTLSIDYTTVLGQVPDTGAWIVRIDGQATDRGEYWWPVHEHVAISRSADGTPVVDDATDEQIALFEDEDEIEVELEEEEE